MTTNLRRFFNHLPLPQGGGEIYVRPSWHKPTPFDQCVSRPPFRMAAFDSYHGRKLRLQLWGRRLLRWGMTLAIAWVVLESARALVLL